MHSTDPFSADNNGDQATIYEGMNVQLTPAPFFKRFIAYAVDMAVVSLMLYGLFLVCIWLFIGGLSMSSFLHNALGVGGDSTLGIIVAGLLIVLIVLVFASIYHGYFVYWEYKRGMTPGKKVFGLKVISLNSSRLSMGQCILRDLFRYVDCGLIIPALSSVAATKKKQRLGDLAASTLVVHSAQKEAQTQNLYLSSDDYYMLRDSVPFKEISLDDCKHYLSFAYPEFVMGTRVSTAESLVEWERWAKSLLQAEPNPPMEQRTILLYLAEHCFQTLNQKQS